MCGDSKIAINPYLVVDQHPLPRPEELFRHYLGVKSLVRLICQQMVLEEDSYVVINTHKGLYRYTHLPFGIASALAVFQRTMDIIL